MTRKQIALAVAALLVFSMVAVAPATAQDSGILSELETDDRSERASLVADGIIPWATGKFDRLTYTLSDYNPIGDESDAVDVVEVANHVETGYDDNPGEWETWYNSRATTVNATSAELVFENSEGDTATRYVVADKEDVDDDGVDEYTNTSIRSSLSDDADKRIKIDGYALANAKDEFDEFETFVADNETPSVDYLGRVKGAYGEDVCGTVAPSVLSECGGE